MPTRDELTEKIALLQDVLRITREQLVRSMYLNAELEGMLNMERELVAELRKKQDTEKPQEQ